MEISTLRSRIFLELLLEISGKFPLYFYIFYFKLLDFFNRNFLAIFIGDITTKHLPNNAPNKDHKKLPANPLNIFDSG
jgi:hypothetical protein